MWDAMGSGLTKLFGMTNKVNSITPEDGIYHERQCKELCAMHALNNLLQEPLFTQKSLDDICQQMTPSYSIFNPHKSMFGTGNYDINVIMMALKSKGFEVIWFDKRREIDYLNIDNIEGFIINAPSEYKLGGIIPFSFNHKHWFTVRQIKDKNGNYYNLDSKLKTPSLIGDVCELREYLLQQLKNKDKELLLVVKDEVQQGSTWKLKPSDDKELCCEESVEDSNNSAANIHSHVVSPSVCNGNIDKVDTLSSTETTISLA